MTIDSTLPLAHVTECPTPLCDDQCPGYEDCDHGCICAELRACEQRVAQGRREDVAEARTFGYSEGYHEGYDVGYTAGRDAALTRATESVAAMDDIEPSIHGGEPQGLDSEWVLVRRRDVLALLASLDADQVSNTEPDVVSSSARQVPVTGHCPECPNVNGPCCTWMTGADGSECDCQCMCEFADTVEQRVLAEEADRTRERVTVAYGDGRVSVLAAAVSVIGAAVDMEAGREPLDEGLLTGLRYALRCLGHLAADRDGDEGAGRYRRQPVGSVYADLLRQQEPAGTYQAGFLAGVQSQCWTCGDCGNTYSAVVSECPNRDLDEAVVAAGRTARDD